MERSTMKSLPSQRIFNTNAERFFNQHIRASENMLIMNEF